MISREQLDDKQLAAILDSAVQQADQHRSGGLSGAQTLASAHAKALDLEHGRVSAKYGAESPQTTEIAQRLALQTVFAATAHVESQRSQVPVPTIPSDGSVVSGRVITVAGVGVPQMTVAALDASETLITYACSDDNGVFSLQIPSAASRSPAVTSAGEAPHTPPHRAHGAHAVQGLTGAERAIKLRVTDEQQQTRFEDAQTMTVAPGRAYYREIAIGEAEKTCVPPPSVTEGKARPSPEGGSANAGF